MKKEIINKKCLKKGLYIIATPIGNLGDISKRVVETLNGVDFIICENPKHSLKLLNNQGIKKKLLSLHDYNEEKLINKISKIMHSSSMALISDAGSPLISDPGFKLVKYLLDNNIYVTTIPGASSIISSLQLSGLPINSFAFYGFVPKQKNKIKQFFSKINNIGLTAVFFVPAKYLDKTIHNIAEFMGERKISICKELTKLNEGIIRSTTSDILRTLKEQNFLLKGELTLVVSGKVKKNITIINNNVKEELVKLLKKYNLTEVVKIVHSLTGISKKDIYQMAIKLKDD